MRTGFSRRKFLAISAAAAGMELVPFGAEKRAAAASLVEWRGLSLGSVATIRIHHSDRLEGERLLSRVVSEAERLEAIFSLYRTDSDLCELNRRGVLIASSGRAFGSSRTLRSLLAFDRRRLRPDGAAVVAVLRRAFLNGVQRRGWTRFPGYREGAASWSAGPRCGSTATGLYSSVATWR